MNTVILDDVERLLTKPLKEIFGGGIDAEERRLLAICHPDLHGGSARATELFKRIKQLAEQARRPAALIKGLRHTYALGEKIASGDIADLHHGEADGRRYVLKISRVPNAVPMMKAEEDALKKIHTAAGDAKYRLYFPLLVEAVSLHHKFPRRMNVTESAGGFFSLADVLAKHGKLDGRHLGWIFKRLLTALGFAHRQGLVHGAVLPQHIRLHPDNHGLMLVGWGQSVKTGERITAVPAGFKSWYPPEVLAKKPATAETDIYMAANCALHLCGYSPPVTIGPFLAGCMLPGQKMRPGDAWEVLDQFDEVLRRLYGPPRFHVLEMA